MKYYLQVFSMLNQYDISQNSRGHYYGMADEEGCGFIKKEINCKIQISIVFIIWFTHLLPLFIM